MSASADAPRLEGRLGAALLDNVPVYLVVAVVFCYFFSYWGQFSHWAAAVVVFVAVALVSGIAEGLYGVTPGKRLAG